MLAIHKNYVIDENQQPIAVVIPITEFEQIYSVLENLKEEEEEPSDIDVEKDIVVRMEPHSQRSVKVRVKHQGRGKLQVVYDPLPQD